MTTGCLPGHTRGTTVYSGAQTPSALWRRHWTSSARRDVKNSAATIWQSLKVETDARFQRYPKFRYNDGCACILYVSLTCQG